MNSPDFEESNVIIIFNDLQNKINDIGLLDPQIMNNCDVNHLPYPKASNKRKEEKQKEKCT